MECGRPWQSQSWSQCGRAKGTGTMEVLVTLAPGTKTPSKAHDSDAGFDLSATSDFVVPPRGGAVVGTGVSLAIPAGLYGQIQSRSGLAFKHDLVAFAGVIDSGYRGELKVKLFNHGDVPYKGRARDRIAQLVVLVLPEVSLSLVRELPDADRGTTGFGASGL